MFATVTKTLAKSVGIIFLLTLLCSVDDTSNKPRHVAKGLGEFCYHDAQLILFRLLSWEDFSVAQQRMSCIW